MSLRGYDRTVHASNRDVEVVRYDRAGKWYVEWRTGGRHRVSIREAAKWALLLYENGGTIVYGKPGGSMFDRLIPQETAAPNLSEAKR